jgi:hypothetical protein
MAREGGIHELELFFLSAREVKGLKAKCIICGEEVSEGYGIISDIIDEKGGAYVERLCDGLGMGPEALFKALFVCVGCMFECCSPCERYDAAAKRTQIYRADAQSAGSRGPLACMTDTQMMYARSSPARFSGRWWERGLQP